MRILFHMSYPGYLRYYGSTVRLLAERGHTVYLSFDNMHKQAEGLKAVPDQGDRVVVLGPVPRTWDVWRLVTSLLRGTVDYIRYLDPRYANSPYLRGRMEQLLPPFLYWLKHVPLLPTDLLRIVIKALLSLEQVIPTGQLLDNFVKRVSPDVAVVTPLVVAGSSFEVDIIKSLRARSVNTAVGIASWDHLTTKGLMRIQPDLVLVWNELQKIEAEDMHGVDPDAVVVTGAQPFDAWFDRQPSTTREEFCQKVGLPTDRPFVLFVGSTASISAPDAEQHFVRRWSTHLRRCRHAEVRELSILIRPHPYNTAHWATADLSEFENAVVWPRKGSNPVDEGDRNDYFDSLYHSAAVVGINTSAMIESAIVGRPVLTVLAPEFADTQGGTLHFHYLLPEHGGFMRVARNLDEHLDQLADVIMTPGAVQQQLTRFVRAFVRPNGVDTPCTPLVADAIERLARQPAAASRQLPPWAPFVRRLLWAFGCSFFRAQLARRRSSSDKYVRVAMKIYNSMTPAQRAYLRLPNDTHEDLAPSATVKSLAKAKPPREKLKKKSKPAKKKRPAAAQLVAL